MRLPRFGFLLAGLALAGVIIEVFLWYGAKQAPTPLYHSVHHTTCGEPVQMRAEDYDLWGGTRRGLDIALAWLDFCDPVRVTRSDGRQEVWFWLEVEVVGQVFPLAGWGYPWRDILTPFPADPREPRNPWWLDRVSVWAIANDLAYPGGDGAACPFHEANARGLDLFFYRAEGFQLPPGMRHAGWVCVNFDNGSSLPDAFTVAIQPDRARITQWVDKLLVIRDTGWYVEPPIPAITEGELCAYARRSHPESVRAACAA